MSDPNRRYPPLRNLEAERAVLGSVLLDPSELPVVRSILRPEDFSDGAIAALYRATCELTDLGSVVDAPRLAVAMEWRHPGSHDWNGLLTAIIEAVPHATNARYYAEIVLDKANGRALVACLDRLAERCYTGSHTVDEVIALALADVKKIQGRDSRGASCVEGGKAR